MLYFRQGSRFTQIIMLLSFTGEFPVCSLSLLGKERVLKTLVHKLSQHQAVHHPQTGMRYQGRILTITGKGRDRSIRLYKGALPMLDWVDPNAYGYYMEAFWGHRFPGDIAHRERNHRVAEAAALCMCAGIEARPYLLPKLQNEEIRQTVAEIPSFYLSRDLKKVGEIEGNKTMFTRMVGALFAAGNCYAVYNTRGAVMRWSGMGELKALYSLQEIARMNSIARQVDAALLLGRSGETALSTLLESEKTRRLELRFDAVYRHIHYIPMDGNGIRQLRILTALNWKEKLLDLLFEQETRSYDRGLFEYDACVDGVYVLSHLDGDIARLVRFKEALGSRYGEHEVLCFPHQTRFLREYLGAGIRIKEISLELLEQEFGIGRRNLFEG